MSRTANKPSVIQQDEALYAIYKAQIDEFTPHRLADYGLVSRTTIYKYLKGEAINQAKEDAIVATLKQANDQRKQENQARLSAARQAVEPQLELA